MEENEVEESSIEENELEECHLSQSAQQQGVVLITDEDIHVDTNHDDEIEHCFVEQIVSETLNCALVDSGCSSSVCGKNWLTCYVDTLPENVDLQETLSKKSFKFGSGPVMHSLKQINLPADIADLKVRIKTDVVASDVPFLLSNKSLKAAKSTIDYVHDQLTMFGRCINLQHTSNGHYCIPLTPKQMVATGKFLSTSEGLKKPLLEVALTAYVDLDQKTSKEKRAMAL